MEMAQEVSIGSLPLELAALEKKATPFKKGQKPKASDLDLLHQKIENCRSRIDKWLDAFDALR